MKNIFVFFLLIGPCSFISSFAQITDDFDDNEEDTIQSINDYEKYNKILGGDSIRYCNGYPCKGWIKDEYPDGTLKHRGFYVNGRLESVYKNYYENGQLERDFSIKNYKASNMLIYYPDGKKLSEIQYQYNDPIFWTDYYPNGQIEYTEKYSNSGEYVIYRFFYYLDGQIQSSFKQVNKKNNLFEKIDFYPDGKIKEQGMMIYNKSLGDYQKTGKWKTFDEKGNLILEEFYYKNKIIDNPDDYVEEEEEEDED